MCMNNEYYFFYWLLTDNILQEIRGRGFSVTQLKEAVLSRDMAEEFYKEQREKPFFKQLVEFMCRYVCTRTQSKGVTTANLILLLLEVLTVMLAASNRGSLRPVAMKSVSISFFVPLHIEIFEFSSAPIALFTWLLQNCSDTKCRDMCSWAVQKNTFTVSIPQC